MPRQYGQYFGTASLSPQPPMRGTRWLQGASLVTPEDNIRLAWRLPAALVLVIEAAIFWIGAHIWEVGVVFLAASLLAIARLLRPTNRHRLVVHLVGGPHAGQTVIDTGFRDLEVSYRDHYARCPISPEVAVYIGHGPAADIEKITRALAAFYTTDSGGIIAEALELLAKNREVDPEMLEVLVRSLGEVAIAALTDHLGSTPLALVGSRRDDTLLPLAAGVDALLACRERTCALS